METVKLLCVDPGEKNIGIAISDESGRIARPLIIIRHTQMNNDAVQIAEIARKHQVGRIIVGLPTGSDGEEIRQSRHSRKLAETLTSIIDISVLCWDESNSTADALKLLYEIGRKKSKRSGHQDDVAACMILQSYINANDR